MVKEIVNQEFRLKNTDETINYLLGKMEQSELICKKHKKVSKPLNYIEYFLILVFTVIGCISIAAFASMLAISIEIMSSPIGLKICAIPAVTKRYKSGKSV